ncbi:17627_t:CDS:2, partial [Racocetra persica]
MSKNIENVRPKVLQIPSGSGELDRIQRIIKTLSADKKKLQEEIELLKSNNPLYEETLKTLNSNINTTISMFNVKFNINDPIEKRMEQI